MIFEYTLCGELPDHTLMRRSSLPHLDAIDRIHKHEYIRKQIVSRIGQTSAIATPIATVIQTGNNRASAKLIIIDTVSATELTILSP
jgi:hypothetical protein